MRLDWRNFDTGWGELLCFVAAWMIVLGAVWLDHAGRPDPRPADKIAASGGRAPSNANLD